MRPPTRYEQFLWPRAGAATRCHSLFTVGGKAGGKGPGQSQARGAIMVGEPVCGPMPTFNGGVRCGAVAGRLCSSDETGGWCKSVRSFTLTAQMRGAGGVGHAHCAWWHRACCARREPMDEGVWSTGDNGGEAVIATPAW